MHIPLVVIAICILSLLIILNLILMLSNSRHSLETWLIAKLSSRRKKVKAVSNPGQSRTGITTVDRRTRPPSPSKPIPSE